MATVYKSFNKQEIDTRPQTAVTTEDKQKFNLIINKFLEHFTSKHLG